MGGGAPRTLAAVAPPVRSIVVVALLTLAALVPARDAAAHPANLARARITVGDTAVRVELSVNLFELDLLLGLDRDLDGGVTAAELEVARPAVAAYLRRTLEVAAAGGRLEPELGALRLARGADGKPLVEAVVMFPRSAAGPVEIAVTPLQELGADHTTLATIGYAGRVEEFAFRAGARWTGREGSLRRLARFGVLGVEHIGRGLDHLAFVAGLVLGAGRLRSVVVIVTAFTAAHSVTLALGALDLVRLPERLVEALIALSIVWVGAENLFRRSTARRWLLGFGFGLVHGLGFAAVLRDLGLPTGAWLAALLAFNAGVEVGQLAVVTALVLLLRLLAGTRLRRPATLGASCVVLAAGLWWLWERVW